MNLPYKGGRSANLYDALRTVEDSVFTSFYGARSGQKKIIIIFSSSDYDSNTEDLIRREAARLIRNNIVILTVAVTRQSDRRILDIIRSSDETLYAEEYLDLYSHLREVLGQICCAADGGYSSSNTPRPTQPSGFTQIVLRKSKLHFRDIKEKFSMTNCVYTAK